MCSAAIAHGLKVSINNCNVQSDQRCCGGETVGEQQQFAHTIKYDFVACENYMYTEMDLEYYTYITTLRDSMARYMSHYYHVMRTRQIELMRVNVTKYKHACGTTCSQY
jgi:hypothetical protein